MAEEVRPCRQCGKWIEARAVECRHCGAKLVDVGARRRSEAEAASAAAAAAAAHAEQERRLAAGGAPAPGPRPWSVGVVAAVASIVLGLAIGLTEPKPEPPLGRMTPNEDAAWVRAQPRGAQFWFGVSLTAVAVQWLLLRGAILSALRAERVMPR